jgi:hypothetical protein
MRRIPLRVHRATFNVFNALREKMREYFCFHPRRSRLT